MLYCCGGHESHQAQVVLRPEGGIVMGGTLHHFQAGEMTRGQVEMDVLSSIMRT